MSNKVEDKIVGVFPMVADLLHLGHLYSLREAKKYCDKLIVVLNVDPTVDNPNKNKPIETVYERWFRLGACKYVDEIIPYCGEEDLMRLLTTTDYQIRFIGEDHKDSWTGKDYEDLKGIKAHIIPRRHNESSTNLRERIIRGK